jgi:hypothetical protein
MPAILGITKTLGKSVRTGLTLSLAFISLMAVSVPSRASDGGAIAAGMLGGVMLGTIAGAAAAHAAPPPQQTRVQYVPSRVQYVPVYVQAKPRAPRHCWIERREVYDGEDYVARKVKVCP